MMRTVFKIFWKFTLSCFIVLAFSINIFNANAQEKSTDFGPYITVSIALDKYERMETANIMNIAGDLIVKKIYEYKGYNPQIKTKIKTVDVVNDKIILEQDCDSYGKVKNPMRLIFDDKGNLIRKAGKPILVKSFEAKGISQSKIKYDGSFKVGVTVMVYKCENCVEHTGIKNCKFVW